MSAVCSSGLETGVVVESSEAAGDGDPCGVVLSLRAVRRLCDVPGVLWDCDRLVTAAPASHGERDMRSRAVGLR